MNKFHKKNQDEKNGAILELHYIVLLTPVKGYMYKHGFSAFENLFWLVCRLMTIINEYSLTQNMQLSGLLEV